MIVPLLKPILQSEHNTRYFLLLASVFTFLISQTIEYSKYYNIEIAGYLNVLSGYMNYHFTLGYVSYFVLGCYINALIMRRTKIKWIGILLWTIGFLWTVFGVFFAARKSIKIRLFIWYNEH